MAIVDLESSPAFHSPVQIDRCVPGPDDEPGRKAQRLLRWLRDNGGDHAPMVYRTVDRLGGMHATAFIPKDALVVRVPRHALVSADRARTSAIGRQVTAAQATVSDRGLIAAYLLSEQHAGSFWAPYIDALPADFSEHPVLALADCPVGGGPLCTGITKGLFDAMRDDFAALTSVLGDAPPWTRASFERAWCWVLTRQRKIPLQEPTSSALIPVTDMLNHSPTRNTRWKECDDGFHMLAARDIQPHEALTDSYGGAGNPELTAVFGFSVENNRSNGTCVGFDGRQPDAHGAGGVDDAVLMVRREWSHNDMKGVMRRLRHLAGQPLDAVEGASDRPADIGIESVALESLAKACNLARALNPFVDTDLIGLSPGHRLIAASRREEDEALREVATAARQAMDFLAGSSESPNDEMLQELVGAAYAAELRCLREENFTGARRRSRTTPGKAA